MPITKNAYNELKRRSRDHFLIAYNEIFGMMKKIIFEKLEEARTKVGL